MSLSKQVTENRGNAAYNAYPNREDNASLIVLKQSA